MRLCEAPIDVLRGAVLAYRKAEHPSPLGKQSAEQLVEYMKQHPRARKMLPKVYRTDAERAIPLSVVRKTITAYRRRYHPAVSRMRRAELEAYMRRAKIKPVGSNLPKLKRDHCSAPATAADEQAAIDSGEITQQALKQLGAREAVPKTKAIKRRRTTRKTKKGLSDAGLKAVAEMMPGLEARAAQMDEDPELAW